ncbi:MAG: hypothetical protein ACI815_001168 [Psychroserpens sp.]|jgi:hypothetical protein
MLTSKTFFGILFEVPLPTALGIEVLSFLIFSGLSFRKHQKNITDSPTFFLQGISPYRKEKGNAIKEFIDTYNTGTQFQILWGRLVLTARPIGM